MTAKLIKWIIGARVRSSEPQLGPEISLSNLLLHQGSYLWGSAQSSFLMTRVSEPLLSPASCIINYRRSRLLHVTCVTITSHKKSEFIVCNQSRSVFCVLTETQTHFIHTVLFGITVSVSVSLVYVKSLASVEFRIQIEYKSTSKHDGIAD